MLCLLPLFPRLSVFKGNVPLLYCCSKQSSVFGKAIFVASSENPAAEAGQQQSRALSTMQFVSAQESLGQISQSEAQPASASRDVQQVPKDSESHYY